MAATPVSINPDKLQAGQRLLGDAILGSLVTQLVALGNKLGLYQALRDAGAVTSTELAERTGLHERWLREWLRAQAAAGVIAHAGAGRFALSPELALLLTDEEDLRYMSTAFISTMAYAQRATQIPEAFRSGLGVTLDERGPDTAAIVERTFATWYRQVLVPVALPRIAGLVDKLSAGVRVADVGCGAGVALIEMAKAFPRSRFHGYDISRYALQRAEENRERAGLENVQFHHAADEPLPTDGDCALITTFDCLHDMTHPEQTAAAIRAACAADGVWLIADIDGRETFEQNLAENPLAARMYSVSVLACLSSSMAEPGSVGYGTLGLPEPAMRELTEAAGFSRFRRLDLANPVNAYYVVQP